VGIAGEDDLDAPDLNGGLDGGLTVTSTSGELGPHAGAAGPAPPLVASGPAALGRRKPVRPSRVILDHDDSRALCEHLLAELGALTDVETLTAWAGKILPQKNKLVTSDAEGVESAFAAKLHEFGSAESSHSDTSLGINNPVEPAARDSSATETMQSPSRKLNGHRMRLPSTARENGSAEAVTSQAGAERSVTPIGKTLRLRDRDHLKFVSAQPCLACGRSPSDAHHLKFAQGHAFGRKVSDEFTVPLCRTHHRDLHRHGDERVWWGQVSIDPLLTASALWGRTHPALADSHVNATSEDKCADAGAGNGNGFYETKPIITADVP
jgi:hypothetical protein